MRIKLIASCLVLLLGGTLGLPAYTGIKGQRPASKISPKPNPTPRPGTTVMPLPNSAPRPGTDIVPPPNPIPPPGSDRIFPPADDDEDGIPTAVEDQLLARFRPFYRFSKYYNADEEHRPADVWWFVQRSELMDHHSETDTPVISNAKLATADGPSLILTEITSVTSLPSTSSFYLNIDNDFRSGEPDWGRIQREAVGLYGHVYPLYEDPSAPTSLTGYKIEYWQFYAFNPVPGQICNTTVAGSGNSEHEGDWEGVELVIGPDKRTIRRVRHNIHSTAVAFEVKGSSISLGGGFVEFRGPNFRKSFDLYVNRDTEARHNSVVRFFCNEDGCTHPVVYIEHGGHASWPTEYWFWPFVLNHDGNSSHAYLVATPPNVGEIGRPNPQCPACSLVVGFNGHWGACGEDPPTGPPLKDTWGRL